MLTFGELKSLSNLGNKNNFFISLYLNVSRVTNPRGDYIIHYKNMVKKTLENIEKQIEKKIEDDLERIEAYLRDNKREFKKSIAIISCDALGVWRAYHLSIPVKNELIIDNTPYLKPLILLLTNYERYGVLLVDKELAKIFIVHLGEIKEYTELFTPDVPGRHKKGGWYSLQQKRFERHIDYHVNLHIKDIIKTLEHFLNKENINKIIIGGSEDVIIRVKNLLSPMILKKVISTFHADTTIGEKEVLEKASKILEKIENEREREKVEELITRTMKRNMAVTGIEDVLINLQEGNVRELVVLKEMSSSGFRCLNCNFLTIQRIKSCPYCSGNFEEVNYLVDFAAQKAVEQGASVHLVSDNRELLQVGGIGAFLRF
jgi:peptide chain release factor subunit 1